MAAVEVITSVERRRRWSREEKLRIVAETARPGTTVSQVARANGLAPGQLFTWRRQLLAAAIGDCESESGFVPVRIAPDPVASPMAPPSSRTEQQPIDIRLPNGIVVRVGRDVEVEALRRVLAALAGP
jgi:transposase